MKLKAVFLFIYIIFTIGCASQQSATQTVRSVDTITWAAYEPEFVAQCKTVAEPPSDVLPYLDCMTSHATIIHLTKAPQRVFAQGVTRVVFGSGQMAGTCQRLEIEGISESTVFGTVFDKFNLVIRSMISGSRAKWDVDLSEGYQEILIIPVYPFWNQDFTISCK